MLYYAEACAILQGPYFRHCACGRHSSFRRNAAAVASGWQLFVRFDRPKIWTSYLPLQRRKSSFASSELQVQRRYSKVELFYDFSNLPDNCLNFSLEVLLILGSS